MSLDARLAGLISAIGADVKAMLRAAPSRVFDVSRYGALGNGVADDTAAIQAALAALTAAGGGELRFPPGVFMVNAMFTLPAYTLVRGAGKGVTRIVQMATANVSAIFNVAGTVGPWVACSNSPGPTGTNIGAPGHGLAVGDLFVLADQFSYTPTDASYMSGEMLRVGTITGDVIGVRGFVTGSWAAANGQYTMANGARVAKISPVNGVKICDLTVAGRTDIATSGIKAQWVNNLTVDGFEMDGGVVGVFIHGCRNVSLTNLALQDLRDDLANGFAGYGMCISGPCAGVNISGVHVARVRHGITTIGGNYGFVHRMTVSDSTATETTSTPWDLHASGEDITFDGLMSTASPRGVLVRARGVTVQNCHLEGRDFDGEPGLFVGETNAKDVVFRNNRVVGFRMGCYIINTAEGGFTVEGNIFENIGRLGIGVNSSNPNVRILNNVLINYSAALTQQPGIQNLTPSGSLADGSTWLVAGNVLVINAGQTAGNPILMTFASMVNVVVINNVYTGLHQSPIAVTAASARNNVRLDAAWPVVSGAKSSNAALTSLCAQLAAQGLITNSTT